jgi:hypothetical protein
VSGRGVEFRSMCVSVCGYVLLNAYCVVHFFRVCFKWWIEEEREGKKLICYLFHKILCEKRKLNFNKVKLNLECK